MNKFIYIFVAIAAISFVSCTQERAKEKELKVLSWKESGRCYFDD